MLILASASPRRRELLAQAGISSEVQPAEIPEEVLPGEDGVQLATRLARQKAQAVFAARLATQPSSDEFAGSDGLVVLGADTVVVCAGELLGKPQDLSDALRMLRLLSGRTHQVITGVALVSGSQAAGSQVAPKIDVASELTHVSMKALSEAEIAAYVASGEPMDKAGAYAIQGYAARWIPRISGCYFNVVGLPLALVVSLLEGARGSSPGDC